ncbi:unnamed protein product [Hyaloperonospora brassicae]|uniref:Trehalose-phosphatase n=1 Tax=Hyaloperonospora brassicae TaxID=162125 RepID=A0AAV0UKP1_HYABA|nr:unnamed protein product [Hyaloperonospora brassicae]
MTANSSSFKDREAALLRELSALYTKLNDVRDKRVKEEQESGAGGASANASADDGAKGARRRRRVLLVTRTLPFWLVSEDAQSQWRAEFRAHASLDGAMELFQSLHDSYDCVWIGSVHGEIEPSEQNTLKEQLLQDRKYYPVFLDEKREKLYYQGFCKTVLWPLFHSCPPTTDDQIAQHEMMEDGQEDDWSMEKMWQAYVAANQAFADAVQEVYEEGDLVWIQGYHLTLVPQMVRNLFPNDKVCLGFFMHVPFPSAELYRILNNREEILTGMLAADLIGFQTSEYARHFQSACVRILGLESSQKGVELNGHFALVVDCPVGIDVDKYTAMMQSEAVQEQMKQLKSQFAGKKVILGVDQLDQTKGLVHKLLAVEELFIQKPALAKKVVFLQIVTGATVFESALESQVESLVSRINSKLQDIGTEGPVQYLHKEIAVEALIALYALADALVITPIRDGMNTIPFGYVVCREATKKPARLILSDFAGCAQALGKARIVNPWNTLDITSALLESLHDNDEVVSAHQHMFRYVSSFTSRHWADTFLDKLDERREESAVSVSGRELSRRDMTSAYSRSSRRLIVINYEGVLAVEASIPELAYPPQELIWQLSMLTNDPRNAVVLVSARSTSVCDQWFAELSGNIILAAEYGVYVKWSGDKECWHCMIPDMDMSWWEHVVPLLEYYTERTPGAYIERKDSSVAWHYRDCDLDHGLWQASELLVSLREITRYLPVSVYPGNRYLEVRPQKVSKAALFERIWEFMNWSSLFPHKDPVTTDYFGEPVYPPPSPMMRPRGYRTELPSEIDLAAPILDHVDSQLTGSGGDRKDVAIFSARADAVVSGQLDGVDGSQPVDFVLLIASGDDRTDEDLFAFLVPPPIDLEAYSRQLEKDGMSDAQRSVAKDAEYNGKGVDSSTVGDVGNDIPNKTFRRLSERELGSTPLDESSEKRRSSLARLSSLPNVGESTMSGKDVSSMVSRAKPPTHEGGAKMFPVSTHNRSYNALRNEITERSKLTSRDFPPSAALFKAMKAKYGESVGLHRLPDTVAACWALVGPPDTPLKAENGAKPQDSSGLASMEENVSVADKSAATQGSNDAAAGGANTSTSACSGLAALQPDGNGSGENGGNSLRGSRDQAQSTELCEGKVMEQREVDDGRYRFPVNTFVCTLGRKVSQAPYYIKNSGDLFQLVQEMGMSSHIRKQRMLSVDSTGHS